MNGARYISKRFTVALINLKLSTLFQNANAFTLSEDKLCICGSHFFMIHLSMCLPASYTAIGFAHSGSTTSMQYAYECSTSLDFGQSVVLTRFLFATQNGRLTDVFGTLTVGIYTVLLVRTRRRYKQLCAVDLFRKWNKAYRYCRRAGIKFQN